jgi:hypothetical protein
LHDLEDEYHFIIICPCYEEEENLISLTHLYVSRYTLQLIVLHRKRFVIVGIKCNTIINLLICTYVHTRSMIKWRLININRIL